MRLFVAALVSLLILLSNPALARSKVAQNFHLCVAEMKNGYTKVRVERRFKSNGEEISAGYRGSATRAGDSAHAALIRQQLYDRLSALLTNLEKNCPADSKANQHRLHSYNCSLVGSEGREQWAADGQFVSWSYKLGEGLALGSVYSVQPDDQLITNGFANALSGGPTLLWDRPKSWGRGNHGITRAGETKWHYTEAAQISVGKAAYLKWTTSNVILSIRYHQLAAMLSPNDDDVRFVAWDIKKGVLTDHLLPRAILTAIEQRMKSAHKKYLRKIENMDEFCTPTAVDYDEIVIS